jgi:hypothetical protein
MGFPNTFLTCVSGQKTKADMTDLCRKQTENNEEALPD